MKQPFRSRLLPLFTVGAGIVGLLLRIWLFSAIDEKGLLPAKHFADTALFILSAITLGVVFLAGRAMEPPVMPKALPRVMAATGSLLGGIGLLLTGLGSISVYSVRFAGIAVIANIAGGIALLAMAVLLFLRKKPPYVLPTILTAALMLDTISQCQLWGTEPQLQSYFFPLMAAVFLILTAYQLTLRIAGSAKPDLLVFFSQSALFFCCTCLNTDRWLLSLGLLFWAAATLYSPIQKPKEV